jgi:shikimate kinase
MNLVFIGFMGVGKTSVGRAVAERLGRPFVDTDASIEHVLAMSVAEIFEKHGEALFRKVEKSVVEEVARQKGCVIATGGGVVLDRENVDRLQRHGLLIHLTLSPETIYHRIGYRSDRPLLRAENPWHALTSLFHSRERLYRACCDLTIDRNGLSVEETMEKVLALVASPEITRRPQIGLIHGE